MSSTQTKSPSLRHRLEFWALRSLVVLLGILPRRTARAIGAALGWLLCGALGRLRRVGQRNLALALPEVPVCSRTATLGSVYRFLGWHIAEFCQMRHYTLAQAQGLIRYDGLDRYLAARDRGKGVLVLTGHLGAWELSSFFHSLAGYPMAMVIRRLDNPLVDAYVNRIRCLHGNRVLHKDDFARGILTAMHRGETVGILMDTNMTPPQGVFVPFFGMPACTATAMARVALRTDAAVVPGFLLWDESERAGRGGYVLHFGDALQLLRTDDPEADIVANTALFNATLESYIRRTPGQWLWVHRRWKTRPAGEPPLY